MEPLRKYSGTPTLHVGVFALLIGLRASLFVSVGYSQPDRYVIHVIVDGARYSETLGDTLARFTPRMQQLAGQGAVIETFLNDGYTYTSRAIPAIWCGSWSVPKDTVVGGYSTQYATVPTVWEYYRKHYGVDSTQALRVMKFLTGEWLPSYFPGYGPNTWPYYVLQGSRDLDVWATARQKLQTHHPRLSEIYLADVDSYGHSGDWNAYTQAIRTADSIVGMLWDFVQSDPLFFGKTTILVSNDHGRHLDGVNTGFVGHGDECWGCRRIMFLGVGANMVRGARLSEQRTLLDITPTIGAILQFPTPYASGKPITGILTDVDQDIGGSLPEAFALLQNYPNPFNAATVVSYQLPVASDVRLSVYDLLGREVALLVDENQEAGSYSLHWNANAWATGVYICRLQAGSDVTSKKMVLAR
jgi:hypothetical protein